MQFQFNAQQFQPQYGTDGGGLPAGRHKVVIEKSELVPTKDNSGQYLQFTLKCVEGLAGGGTQKDRLNVHNNNPQTVAIANQQLAAYCAVTGKPGFNDTSELHNISFFVEVGAQRNNPEFTEIKKLFDINGNEAGKSSAPAQVNQDQQQPPAGFGPAGSGFQPQTTPGVGGWGPQTGAAAQAPIDPAPAQTGWGNPGAPQTTAAPGWSPQGGGSAAPGWGPR